MITRAHVVDIKPGYVQVRIPILNNVDPSAPGYTSDDNLYWATVNSVPGIEVDYRPGDTVIIGFEDRDLGRPIVLGHLKTSFLNDSSINAPSVQLGSLTVNDKVILPKDIKIGNITYDQLQTLESPEGTVDLTPVTQTDIDSLFI